MSKPCDQAPCTGRRIERFTGCLAHLSDHDVKWFVDGLKPGADLDVRGTTISEDLLSRLMAAADAFGEVNFENVEFEGAEKIGPLVARSLILDGAKFARPVTIEVKASRVSCVGTRFEGGVVLRVRDAAIDATEAVFGPQSSITTSLAFAETADPPLLVSLRGTDVSNLVLVDVDVRWCLFVGAYRLDQLRLEGRCEFQRSQARWRWTRRQMLAEEQFSRRLIDEHPFLPIDPWISQERLAVLYRSLRKAFEDSKNEAGAGDFYYGEMEARRRSAMTPAAERLILGAYRVLSGHGQRAGRAVAGIAALVTAVTVLLFTVGLPGGVVWTWGRVDQALRIGMGAVVFRDAGQALTSAGNWTVMVARFAGPVLLALAVLAIRARVKR